MNSRQRRVARRNGTLKTGNQQLRLVPAIPLCPDCGGKITGSTVQYGQESYVCENLHWGPWRSRIRPKKA